MARGSYPIFFLHELFLVISFLAIQYHLFACHTRTAVESGLVHGPSAEMKLGNGLKAPAGTLDFFFLGGNGSLGNTGQP